MEERYPGFSKDMITKAVWVLVCITGFSFAAHAYRCFHLMYSHDSLMVFQNNVDRQVSLGRFLQPVYWNLRGQLCAPLLLGITSVIWLTLAACIVINVLGIQRRITVFVICGVLATSSSLSLSYATYLPWIDIFTLSLLFCVLGVFLWRRYPRRGFLFGMLPIMVSMALYQAYFQSAVILSMIILAKEILEGETFKKVVIDGTKALCMLLGGCLFYYAAMQIVLLVTATGAATSYNGMSRIGGGNMTLKYLCFMLMKTYVYVLDEIVRPVTYNPYGMVTGMNILLLVLACAGIIRMVYKKKLSRINVLLLAALLLAMPFGVNVVYFISRGVEHPLMTYSFSFGYILAVLIFEMNTEYGMQPLPLQVFATALIVWIIWDSIVFANQLYLKKGLEEQATLSCMTRIVDRMEQMEDYAVNETPVVLIGQLEHSGLAEEREGFAGDYGVGMARNFAVTDYESYEDYFEFVLGYPIHLLSESESERYAGMEEVQRMPDFPAKDSCKYVDGVLVVKLSAGEE